MTRSVGTKLATFCAQTGTIPAMIEKARRRRDFDLIEAALGGVAGRLGQPWGNVTEARGGSMAYRYFPVPLQ